MTKTLGLAVIVLQLLAGCQAIRQALKPTVLQDSLSELRDHFNAHREKARVVALLSPT